MKEKEQLQILPVHWNTDDLDGFIFFLSLSPSLLSLSLSFLRFWVQEYMLGKIPGKMNLERWTLHLLSESSILTRLRVLAHSVAVRSSQDFPSCIEEGGDWANCHSFLTKTKWGNDEMVTTNTSRLTRGKYERPILMDAMSHFL
jgi:hypothetical protein